MLAVRVPLWQSYTRTFVQFEMQGRVRYFSRLVKHLLANFSRAPPYRTFVLWPKHHGLMQRESEYAEIYKTKSPGLR